MQVIMVSEFGGPEVLELGEAEIPQPHAGEVLVRVIAAGVGPWDASFFVVAAGLAPCRTSREVSFPGLWWVTQEPTPPWTTGRQCTVTRA